MGPKSRRSEYKLTLVASVLLPLVGLVVESRRNEGISHPRGKKRERQPRFRFSKSSPLRRTATFVKSKAPATLVVLSSLTSCREGV